MEGRCELVVQKDLFVSEPSFSLSPAPTSATIWQIALQSSVGIMELAQNDTLEEYIDFLYALRVYDEASDSPLLYL